MGLEGSEKMEFLFANSLVPGKTQLGCLMKAVAEGRSGSWGEGAEREEEAPGVKGW